MAPYWLLLLPTLLLAWTALAASAGVAIGAADRNEPFAITPRVLAQIAREATARAALLLLAPFGWIRSQGRPQPGPADPGPTAAGPAGSRPAAQSVPVLLVPGLTWNRSSFWPLATFLRRRGWRWVHPIDRRSRQGTLAAEAEALADAVRELSAASGAHQIDIVAFSTGGLVAAWYLRHHGAERVRRLITLGTAWRGTRMAVFGRGRAVDEIRFGSHILDGLWPTPVPTVCVFSPDDPVVVPAASAIPPDGADAVQVEACGHVEMLLSARVYRAIQAALDRPGPAPRATAEDQAGSAGATIVPLPGRGPHTAEHG